MKVMTAPAPATFPVPAVADLVAELGQLTERRRDAQAHQASLTGNRLDSQARTRDADLLAETARAGGDVAAVGTPTMDKLTADREAAAAETRAIDGAIARVSADLQAAVIAHHAELEAAIEAVVDAAAAHYAATVDATADARRAFVEAVAVREWVERVRDAGPSGLVSHIVRHDARLPGSTLHPPQALAGMRREAEAKGRHTPRPATAVPAPTS